MRILILALALGFTACTSPKNLTGSTKPPAPPPVSPSPMVSQFIPQQPAPTCTNQGITSTQLTQTTIRNNAPNQFLNYILTILNCVGQPTDLSNKPILFDVNGMVSQAQIDRPINFRIFAQSGAQLAAGQMAAIAGSDLFGNTDASRRHHRTTTNLNIPAGTTQIRLELDLSNTTYHSPSSSSGTPPAQEQIDTYLRFGEAQPATQPVTFLN